MVDAGSGISDGAEQCEACEACEACPLVERRAFLRDVTLGGAAILAALGVAPSRAAAAPLEFVSALRGERGERGEHEDKTYAIPSTDGAQIDKGNGTIVMRWQGKAYVYSLACPHQNTAIRWSDK